VPKCLGLGHLHGHPAEEKGSGVCNKYILVRTTRSFLGCQMGHKIQLVGLDHRAIGPPSLLNKSDLAQLKRAAEELLKFLPDFLRSMPNR
jgi:hypothetical protein